MWRALGAPPLHDSISMGGGLWLCDRGLVSDEALTVPSGSLEFQAQLDPNQASFHSPPPHREMVQQ